MIIDFLKESGKEFMIIMTKSDKTKQSELHKSTQEVKKISEDFLLVSSKKRKNIKKLSKIILEVF